MKKSEMIQKMAAELADMVNCGGVGYLTMAEELLKLCEESGMKPPIKERCPVLITDRFVWEKE